MFRGLIIILLLSLNDIKIIAMYVCLLKSNSINIIWISNLKRIEMQNCHFRKSYKQKRELF